MSALTDEWHLIPSDKFELQFSITTDKNYKDTSGELDGLLLATLHGGYDEDVDVAWLMQSAPKLRKALRLALPLLEFLLEQENDCRENYEEKCRDAIDEAYTALKFSVGR